MFDSAISKDTKTILALLRERDFPLEAYLAGGTGCALQLGHRFSFDLDFFIEKEFDVEKILRVFQNIPKFKCEQIKWGTLLGKFKEIGFSLFYYPYPLIYPTKIFQQVRIADLQDIAAMKLAAIAARGRKRDFIDLYFILQNSLDWKTIFNTYEKKYRNLSEAFLHLMKSLSYFEDAEKDTIPLMIEKVRWAEVKKFFEKETKRITEKLI
ncbi:MAG: nucleotidyl transferase AbiEii/AbiGii toxin family protein [Candidatus Edwardsbacteria bacterium]